MGYYNYLCELLRPLRVYRLDEGSLSGAELYAAGGGLDAAAEALEKAAAARSQRARIKSELKSGELKLSEFFAASETDEVLGKMKVRALLVSLPRVGTTTADAILEDVRIAESRRVRGLGANQRAALVERFG